MSAQSNYLTSILLKVMRIRSHEGISDTENWLDWYWDFENPNDSEDDWVTDNNADMELHNGHEDSATMEVQNVSAASNFP
jgi:hypothetical protein